LNECKAEQTRERERARERQRQRERERERDTVRLQRSNLTPLRSRSLISVEKNTQPPHPHPHPHTHTSERLMSHLNIAVKEPQMSALNEPKKSHNKSLKERESPISWRRMPVRRIEREKSLKIALKEP